MNQFLPQRVMKKALSKVAFAFSLVFFLLPTAIFANTATSTPPNIVVPNPELGNSCGLDIALVLDSSGSINATELGQMKNAFEGFVGAFLPTRPTLFSVTDFDDDGNVLQTFTDDLGLLNIAINAPISGGTTNWADGLNDAFGTLDPRDNSEHPDLIVFASDGNPNHPNIQTALGQAVLKANEIKGEGVRIITFGIGDHLKVDNLKAISSADAVYTSGFESLAKDLAKLAKTHN